MVNERQKVASALQDAAGMAVDTLAHAHISQQKGS